MFFFKYIPSLIALSFLLSVVMTSCSVDDTGDDKKDFSLLSMHYDNIDGVTNRAITSVLPIWSADPIVVIYSIAPALPIGLSLNTNTGEISGIPSSKQLGESYIITAIADSSSQYVGSNTATMTITVKSWLSDLSLNYSNIDGIVNTHITEVSPEWDILPDNVRYAITPDLPVGLSFSSNTGEVSGSHNARYSNAHTVTAYSMTHSSYVSSNSASVIVNIRDHLSSLSLSYANIDGITNSAISPVSPVWSTNPRGVTYSITPSLTKGLVLNANTGEITGTPVSNQLETYTITATADGSGYVGSNTTTMTITVKSWLSDLSLSYSNITGIADTHITIVSPEWDILPDNVRYAITPDLPVGLSFNSNTGVISGASQVWHSNAHTITVYPLSNSIYAGSNVVKMRIDIRGQLSSLSLSYANIDGITNSAISPVSPVWSTNPRGVTYSITPSLTKGLVLNANTGEITGTPVSNQLETYTITATADGSGYVGSNTTTMTITVKSWLSDLSLSYSNITGIADTHITMVSPEWDILPDNVRYAITPDLPVGLSFNSNTGVISGASQVWHSNAHTITVYPLSNSIYAGSNVVKMRIDIRGQLSSLSLAYSNVDVVFGVAIAPVSPEWDVDPIEVTYSISPPLPPGLILNTNTGVISGTSTNEQFQILYTNTVVARDSSHHIGSKVTTFYITINATFGCARIDGLIISEVTEDWMEIYNPRESGSDPVCLQNYELRTSTLYDVTYPDNYFSLPNIVIEPQTYAIIRFEGNSNHNGPNIVISSGPGLGLIPTGFTGFYEITLSNNSVDFIGFCHSDGTLPMTPLTGSFSGCVEYYDYGYLSFSRSLNLIDTDSANDWTPFPIPTFGGQNDVQDVTDNDRDGIPDANEMPGTTFAGMPLYDWGARVNQRDIFVHVSYMEGSQTNRGLAPPQASLEKVKEVFAKNNMGIHIDVGDLYSSSIGAGNFNMSGKNHEVEFSRYATINQEPVVTSRVPGVKSVIEYKNRYVPINRFGIFHHSLFAFLYARDGYSGTTSGVSELPGNDFIIYLGGNLDYHNYFAIVAANLTASLFLHELGHNFDLKHGGGNHNNYKPNHFSSMNYGYTLSGLPERNNTNENNFFFRYKRSFLGLSDVGYSTMANNIYTTNFKIDYSYGLMPSLNENSISEINPLGEGIGNVDWNTNGITEATNYTYNVNPRDMYTGLTEHEDYNEWANMKLPFDYGFVYLGYNSFGSIDLGSSGRGFQRVSPRFNLLREKLSPIIECEIPTHFHD